MPTQHKHIKINIQKYHRQKFSQIIYPSHTQWNDKFIYCAFVVKTVRSLFILCWAILPTDSRIFSKMTKCSLSLSAQPTNITLYLHFNLWKINKRKIIHKNYKHKQQMVERKQYILIFIKNFTVCKRDSFPFSFGASNRIVIRFERIFLVRFICRFAVMMNLKRVLANKIFYISGWFFLIAWNHYIGFWCFIDLVLSDFEEL